MMIVYLFIVQRECTFASFVFEKYCVHNKVSHCYGSMHQVAKIRDDKKLYRSYAGEIHLFEQPKDQNNLRKKSERQLQLCTPFTYSDIWIIIQINCIHTVSHNWYVVLYCTDKSKILKINIAL